MTSSKLLLSILAIALVARFYSLEVDRESPADDSPTSVSTRPFMHGDAVTQRSNKGSPASKFRADSEHHGTERDVKSSRADSLVAKIERVDSELEIFNEEFESGFEKWQGDKNVWQMGVSVHGPLNMCLDDSMCIGTLLDQRYPDYIDAELVSAPIDLPEIQANESVRLDIRNWMDVDLNDSVEIRLSSFDGEIWIDPDLLVVQSGFSFGWQPLQLDISRFSGSKIRIHFRLVQDKEVEGNGSGWYIDDLKITRGQTL